ncbi:MAG: HEAT repeat domain-containing protein [Acidobacteriia bacterium]|nr:HEAT repeat domain-containing protein [Terriglobia bacterium]
MHSRTKHLAAGLLVAGVILPALAPAQSLEGRFYPEKPRYLLGEPFFIELEVKNTGSKPVSIDSRLGVPCIQRDPIEVAGAKHQGFGWDTTLGCYGGIAGSCASGMIELKPGEKYIERIFLNGLYALDHTGVYEVHARRRVPVYPQGVWTPQSSDNREFSSDFQITLVTGTEDDLKAAFAPYVQAATGPFTKDQWQAIAAINSMGPPFLEELILKWADTLGRSNPAALARLNTPRARQKLMELAEHSPQGYIRQEAIQALAKTRDRSYLPVLVRVAETSKDGNREMAIWRTGLFGADAVPFLAKMLRDPDANARVAAARGLGITASRSAVTALIEALRDPDVQVFMNVCESLAELTHHSITSPPRATTPSEAAWRRWHDWWVRNGLAAPIYTTDNCVQPRPLD